MRPAGGVERQLVEALAARLAADVPVHGLLAMLLQGQTVAHWLAYALHAKRVVSIAHRSTLTIDGAEGCAELLRVDSAELWNVIGDATIATSTNRLEDASHLITEPVEIGDDQVASQRPLDDQDVLTHRANEGVEVDRVPLRLRFAAVDGQGPKCFGQPRIVETEAHPPQRLGERVEADGLLSFLEQGLEDQPFSFLA